MNEALLQSLTEGERHYFGIAYRMLGSVTDAEDVLQEARLRAMRVRSAVDKPERFLTTTVTRLAIDRLRANRARREQYVGPWLPEPLLTPAEEIDRPALAESVSMAFLVVLESLNPVERAALLLRDVFGYDYEAVAGIVGASTANCRQIVRRARQRAREGRPRFDVATDKCEELTRRFLLAAQSGDLAQLEALLQEDVTLWSDGGGRVAAAQRPVTGRQAVARFCLAITGGAASDLEVRTATINGQFGVLVHIGGRLDNVTLAEVGDDGIRAIRIIRNPDKLTALARMLEQER